MATLTFKNINKIYDNNVQAVFDFNLDVKDHEFIVFVGPSGCGKSTTLRMVAGLEEISSGELYVGSDNDLVDYDCNNDYEQINEKLLYYYQLDNTPEGLTNGSEIKGYDRSNTPISFLTDRTQIAFKLASEDSKTHFNKLSVHIEYEAKRDVNLNAILGDEAAFNGLNDERSVVLTKENNSIDLNFDEYVLSNPKSVTYFKLEWSVNYGIDFIIKKIKIVDNEQRLINSVEPKDRDIAMVFQSYALYPHMTVYNNIAFGLRLRHVDKNIIDEKVTEVAETLGLTPYLKRKPSALSGGQRQRVALGRAIVRSPKVFLMDEPLSNLDAKLRVTMRSEIAKIHEKVGATTIYVTHDQTEAMTMASRIVVMKDGYIQQIGSPRDVYNLPENVFVGSFIGSPAMNFVECKIDFIKGEVYVYQGESVAYTFKPSKEQINGIRQYFLDKPKEIEDDIHSLNIMIDSETNEKILALMVKDREDFEKELEYYNNLNSENKYSLLLGIRPENIYLLGDSHNMNPSTTFAMEADVTELLGHEFIVYGYIGDARVIVKLGGGIDIKIHSVRDYSFDMNLMHFFDPHTSKRIKLEAYGVKTYADVVNNGDFITPTPKKAEVVGKPVPAKKPSPTPKKAKVVEKPTPVKKSSPAPKKAKTVEKPAPAKKPTPVKKSNKIKKEPETVITKKVVTTVVTTTTSNGETKTKKTKKVSK